MTTLPPLPELDLWEKGVVVRQDIVQQRMTAYGQQCYSAALEEAIAACQGVSTLAAMEGEPEASAAMVRVADRMQDMCAEAIKEIKA